MRRRLLPLLLLVAALFGISPAWGEPFRILYAEQIDLPIARTARGAAVRKPQPGQQLALQAYGREYDLRLEPNDSLAGRLPPEVLEGKPCIAAASAALPVRGFDSRSLRAKCSALSGTAPISTR
ncbi:MAG: hypothetical protein ACREXP_30660 [Steroidobacteraceae bacterium]